MAYAAHDLSFLIDGKSIKFEKRQNPFHNVNFHFLTRFYFIACCRVLFLMIVGICMMPFLCFAETLELPQNAIRVRTFSEIDSLNHRTSDVLKTSYSQALATASLAVAWSREAKYPAGLARAYSNKAFAQLKSNDFKASRNLLDSARSIWSTLKDTLNIANYHLQLGELSIQERDFTVAREELFIALNYFELLKNGSGHIDVEIKIGNTYYLEMQYEKAMQYYLRALTRADSSEYVYKKGVSQINVANVLSSQGKHDDAIAYLESAMDVFLELGDQYQTAVCLNNIGVAFLNSGRPEMAKPNLERTLEIYRVLDDRKGQSAALINLGVASGLVGDFETALSYQNESLEINRSLNDLQRIAEGLANQSNNLLNLSRFAEAKLSAEEGLTVAEQIRNLSIQHELYGNLSIIHDSLKDFSQALRFHRLFKETGDSLLNIESRQNILELEVRYRSAKKNDEIRLLKLEKESNEAKLRNNRTALILLVASIVLGLILVGALYRLYDLRTKSTRSLSEKNLELNGLNQSLESRELELKKANSQVTKFVTILAHDIKNPLSAYRAVAKTLSDSYFDLPENEKLGLIQRLEKSSENLFELFQNLLQWSTSKSGSMRFSPKEINLAIIAYKAVAFMQATAERKEITIDLQMDGEVMVFADRNMVSIILTNLITNAIKFTPRGGEIWISSKLDGGSVEVSVRDSGIGLSAGDLALLFRLDVDHKIIGGSEEKGTGIGLILCHEFVAKNGGRIWAESHLGQGSTFHFTLPQQNG